MIEWMEGAKMDREAFMADLLAAMAIEPGFMVIPQDRYAELVRAETERDILEEIISGDSTYYSVGRAMEAIRRARSLYRRIYNQAGAAAKSTEALQRAE